MIDSELVEFYKGLIIRQYYNRENAAAEIGVMAESWSKVFTLLKSFSYEFDIDTATGDRLDKIGKIVVLRRENLPTAYQNDDSYRKMLKGKIAVNNSSAFIASDERLSIQDVVDLVFDGKIIVRDNKDMSISLLLEPDIDVGLVNAMVSLDLIPRGQGVRIVLELGNPQIISFGPLSSSFGNVSSQFRSA